MRASPLLYLGLVVTVSSTLLAACAQPSRTSITTADDYYYTTEEMAAKLAASEFLANRGPDSDPIVIVPRKVVNKSHDIISLSDQWMLVAKVANSQPIVQLGELKRVYFQLPPEKYDLLRGAGYDGPLNFAREATHEMVATLLSIRRAGKSKGEKYTDLRSDYYYIEYQILDLSNGEIVWQEKVEFTREAEGRVID